MKTLIPIPPIDILSFTLIEERRPVTVVYNGPAWGIVRNKLRLKTAAQIEVTSATVQAWGRMVPEVQGEVIYSVGGGLAVDAAKYLSMESNLPLVCLPTALSVDAFFTWASGIRRDGCVYYIETKIPDRVVIDFDVLASAPASIRAAGIGDVLSIATGSWDWKFAEENGLNPPDMHFIPYVAQTAQAILRGALDCAEAAGRGDAAGLRQLLDCILLEVQLCNLIGHARPEEGSEHYFAYMVENKVGAGKPHADLLAPGILLMAGLQGQDVAPLKKAIQACNLSLTAVPETAIRATLQELPGYVRRHNLPFGIAHTLGETQVNPELYKW